MSSNMILWRVCEYDINSFYNLFLGVAIFDMISRYDMDTTQNKQVSIWCDCIYVKKKKKYMFTLSNTLNNMSIHVDFTNPIYI